MIINSFILSNFGLSKATKVSFRIFSRLSLTSGTCVAFPSLSETAVLVVFITVEENLHLVIPQHKHVFFNAIFDSIFRYLLLVILVILFYIPGYEGGLDFFEL